MDFDIIELIEDFIINESILSFHKSGIKAFRRDATFEMISSYFFMRLLCDIRRLYKRPRVNLSDCNYLRL